MSEQEGDWQLAIMHRIVRRVFWDKTPKAELL